MKDHFFQTFQKEQSHMSWTKGEQGTAGLEANTVLKQTNELCF